MLILALKPTSKINLNFKCPNISIAKKHRYYLFIQFNLKMKDHEDSISIYLTEDCKESTKNGEKNQFDDLFHRGRWGNYQWSLYVYFSLRQFCKSKRSRGQFNSFTHSRRAYSSFDRRFVQFLKTHYFIGYMSKEQQMRLIKRTKSKFNTLKRRFRKLTKEDNQEHSRAIDLPEMIYLEAKKLLENQNQELKVVVEEYEFLKKLKLETCTMESIMPKEAMNQKKKIGIRTRSFTHKQKQYGTLKIE